MALLASRIVYAIKREHRNLERKKIMYLYVHIHIKALLNFLHYSSEWPGMIHNP